MSLPTLARTSSTIHYLVPAGGLTRGRAPTRPVAPDGFGRQPWRPTVCRRRPAGTRGAWRKVSLSERPSDTPVADRGAVAWHWQIHALQLTGCGARSGVLMPARLRVRLRRLGMRAPAPARLPLAPQAFVRPTAQLRLRRPSQPSERRAFCRPTAQLRLKCPSQPVRGFARSAPPCCFPVDGVGAPFTWPSA